MEDSTPYNGSTGKVDKYIELFCDLNSELWKIPDYHKRKAEALKLSGFKKHEPLYDEILNDKDNTIIEREVEYAFDKGGVEMSMYVSLLKNFWQTLARLAQPIDESRLRTSDKKESVEDKELKCYELKIKLRKDLDEAGSQLKKLETSIFKDSESRKKVVKSVRESLSAESMAMKGSVK